MEITKPGYFDRFRCLAGHCPDSCCQEWEVQVDPDSASRYRKLPGPLGNDLRRILRDEDGETYITISDGRCPMWRLDGLCRIQAELGEGALCKTCREFPRLTHDYGDFVEQGLELSCPEAARLILNESAGYITETVPGIGAAEYDRDTMEVLKSTRVKARVKAQALQEIISGKDEVYVMGHRMADVDSFGAAIGIYRIAKTMDKPAHIVMSDPNSSVLPMVELFKNNDEY